MLANQRHGALPSRPMGEHLAAHQTQATIAKHRDPVAWLDLALLRRRKYQTVAIVFPCCDNYSLYLYLEQRNVVFQNDLRGGWSIEPSE